MTKISTAKRSFIIVFIVMFIISLCMGGLFVKYPNNVSANAEDDKTYTVKELFSVDDWVTITEPKKIGTGNTSENILDYDFFPQGSVIQSEKPYNGEIVPTFTKDVSVVFKFINPNATAYSTAHNFNSDNNGDFKFIITDLTDENNYFIIHYTSEGNVQLEYPNDSGDIVIIGKKEVYPKFNNISQNINMFSLEWGGAKNDELNVIISCNHHGKALFLLGCFNDITASKISFPNGYKISFSWKKPLLFLPKELAKCLSTTEWF